VSSRCALCGGPTRPAFSVTDRNRRLSAETFAYDRCLACRTVALREIPGDLGRYYPSAYYTLPEDRAELFARAASEAPKLELLSEFAHGGRLIEVGPAIGAFAVLAQEHGFEPTAIEMDAECCRFLEQVAGIATVHTDDPASALAVQSGVDVVAMWHVIEHLPDPLQVLAAATGALAPGGVIVIATPNPDAFQFQVWGRLWAHVDAPRHLFLVPAEVLVRAGREQGLEVALLTSDDVGARNWNAFGWRESLAATARGPRTRDALRLVGSALNRTVGRLDRRGLQGSAYTLVLRRPADGRSADPAVS
jgi:2-polyprenyl-3-methyl-5-hydroxy-6-metoxy-1,4-benzoquinol methylase